MNIVETFAGEYGQRLPCVPLHQAENIFAMIKPLRPYAKIGTFCLASLASALICCAGCSIHETNRWEQPQDYVTFVLASGTYVSLVVALISFVAFVIALMRDRPAD
jgi:hypothetical protein